MRLFQQKHGLFDRISDGTGVVMAGVCVYVVLVCSDMVMLWHMVCTSTSGLASMLPDNVPCLAWCNASAVVNKVVKSRWISYLNTERTSYYNISHNRKLRNAMLLGAILSATRKCCPIMYLPPLKLWSRTKHKGMHC